MKIFNCQNPQVDIFKNFRLWKGFTVWQKIVKWKKFLKARNYLEHNLFFVNPSLAAGLLTIQGECYELETIKFCNISNYDGWAICYFMEEQTTQFEYTKRLLTQFRKRTMKTLCKLKARTENRRSTAFYVDKSSK